jgi:hypothetical protein
MLKQKELGSGKISCSVLEDKAIGNCSNNGMSVLFNTVDLCWGKLQDGEYPANTAVLKVKSCFGKDYYYAEPLYDPDEGCVGWMFGGTYLKTSDSRFPCLYPVPFHDRQETQKLYNELSSD